MSWRKWHRALTFAGLLTYTLTDFGSRQLNPGTINDETRYYCTNKLTNSSILLSNPTVHCNCSKRFFQSWALKWITMYSIEILIWGRQNYWRFSGKKYIFRNVSLMLIWCCNSVPVVEGLRDIIFMNSEMNVMWKRVILAGSFKCSQKTLIWYCHYSDKN